MNKVEFYHRKTNIRQDSTAEHKINTIANTSQRQSMIGIDMVSYFWMFSRMRSQSEVLFVLIDGVDVG